MNKFLPCLLAALLLPAASAFAAGVHYDTVGHREHTHALQTPAPDHAAPTSNFNIGTPSPKKGSHAYPRDGASVRPRNDHDESVTPALRKEICTGLSCTCESVNKP